MIIKHGNTIIKNSTKVQSPGRLFSDNQIAIISGFSTTLTGISLDVANNRYYTCSNSGIIRIMQLSDNTQITSFNSGINCQGILLDVSNNRYFVAGYASGLYIYRYSDNVYLSRVNFYDFDPGVNPLATSLSIDYTLNKLLVGLYNGSAYPFNLSDMSRDSVLGSSGPMKSVFLGNGLIAYIGYYGSTRFHIYPTNVITYSFIPPTQHAGGFAYNTQNGLYYVGDSANSVVWKFKISPQTQVSIGDFTGTPTGIDFDYTNGRYYVAQGNGTIRIMKI